MTMSSGSLALAVSSAIQVRTISRPIFVPAKHTRINHPCQAFGVLRTDFAYAERVEGYVRGWRRVFHQVRLCSCCVERGCAWAVTRTAGPSCNLVLQGSTDHRGTPGEDATLPPLLLIHKGAYFVCMLPQSISSRVDVCTAAEAPGRTVTLIEETDSITVWQARDAATGGCRTSSRYMCMSLSAHACCSGALRTAWLAHQMSSRKHSTCETGLVTCTHRVCTMSLIEKLASMYHFDRIDSNVPFG